MKLKIPMTGTVIDYDAECAKIDNIGISGSPNDPVRPVNLDLGGIAWFLVSVNLDNDSMEIEVSAPETIDIPMLDDKGKPVLDNDNNQVYTSRPTTPVEKQAILDNALRILGSYKTADEIYAKTGDKKLIKPASVVAKYKLAKAGIV